MDDVTPIKGYVVRDDVLYLITGGSEDLAFLLARNSPVAVSALVHNTATNDVHASASRMLHWAHERETASTNAGPVRHIRHPDTDRFTMCAQRVRETTVFATREAPATCWHCRSEADLTGTPEFPDAEER